jgi:hypothetical protein
MFSLIRGVIIVAVIFYFSPERDLSEPDQKARGGEAPPTATALPALVEDGNTHDGLWSRLVGSLTEEVVRTTVNGKAQEAGLRLKETAWLPEASSRSTAAEAARSSPGQSVRCVYRCDGTE